LYCWFCLFSRAQVPHGRRFFLPETVRPRLPTANQNRVHGFDSSSTLLIIIAVVGTPTFFALTIFIVYNNLPELNFNMVALRRKRNLLLRRTRSLINYYLIIEPTRPESKWSTISFVDAYHGPITEMYMSIGNLQNHARRRSFIICFMKFRRM
jgi:hypothetical protein